MDVLININGGKVSDRSHLAEYLLTALEGYASPSNISIECYSFPSVDAPVSKGIEEFTLKLTAGAVEAIEDLSTDPPLIDEEDFG